MKLLNKMKLGAIVALSLTGCGALFQAALDANQGEVTGRTEVTFPAVLLITAAEYDVDEFLVGEVVGDRSGSARFSVANPTYGRCEGTSTRAGIVTVACSNGYSTTSDVGRQRVEMSGTYAYFGTVSGLEVDGVVVPDFEGSGVMGWGNEANEAAVRAALPAAQAG